MSRVSDLIVEINELLGKDLSNKEIAEIVGCPLDWVEYERECLVQTFHSLQEDPSGE
jgi:hypothetical protein